MANKKVDDEIIVINRKELQPSFGSFHDKQQMMRYILRNPITKKNEKTEYVPIYKIEEYLDGFFGVGGWWWNIDDAKQEMNAYVVRGTIWILNRNGEPRAYMSGIGAQPLQFDAGSTPSVATLKSNALQLAAPSASSYALSNAAQRIGKKFGRSLNGREINESLDTDKMTEEEIAQKEAQRKALFGE